MRTRGMRPVWLIQAARNAEDRPFDKEIHALAGVAGDALSVTRVLSSPAPEAAGSLRHEVTGRVSVELLKDLLPFDDFDFMICGPGGFVQSLYDGLRGMRIPDDRIHAEAFGPATLRRHLDESVPGVSAEAPTSPVSVRFVRSGIDVQWQPGSGTLLELAESSGLHPEFSCRGGSCGICVTRLNRGKVRHIQSNAAFTAPDDVLICSMQPAANGGSDAIELDL
jgi:ferredoxin-NADP reductase